MKSILIAFSTAILIVPAAFAAEPTATGNNSVSSAVPAQPPGQKNQVRGQIVDEAGKPVPGAAWKFAGIEVLKNGKWTRELRMGDWLDTLADAEGRFVIPYGELVRFDLQFHQAGFAPVFLYEIGADSPELKVTLKRGERIHGTVSQKMSGKNVPMVGKTVELRLPSYGVWFQEQVVTDAAANLNSELALRRQNLPIRPGTNSACCKIRILNPKEDGRWHAVETSWKWT